MREGLKQIAEVGERCYYAFEPLQKVLPKLSRASFSDLKRDIEKNGITSPIKAVRLDENRYVVLDGVHRVVIASELGMTFEDKVETIEAGEEDWFRVGFSLNMSAKKGRRLRKRDMVKALYEWYKVKKVDKRPSVEEFRKELESYGLHLALETIKSYLFKQHKPEHHGQRSKPGQVSRAGAPGQASAQDELSRTPQSASNSAQDAENAQALGLSNSTILLNVNSVANQLDTNVEELIKCLFELAPDLQKAAKRFNETPLDMLRKCVEALKKI